MRKVRKTRFKCVKLMARGQFTSRQLYVDATCNGWTRWMCAVLAHFINSSAFIFLYMYISFGRPKIFQHKDAKHDLALSLSAATNRRTTNYIHRVFLTKRRLLLIALHNSTLISLDGVKRTRKRAHSDCTSKFSHNSSVYFTRCAFGEECYSCLCYLLTDKKMRALFLPLPLRKSTKTQQTSTKTTLRRYFNRKIVKYLGWYFINYRSRLSGSLVIYFRTLKCKHSITLTFRTTFIYIDLFIFCICKDP